MVPSLKERVLSIPIDNLTNGLKEGLAEVVDPMVALLRVSPTLRCDAAVDWLFTQPGADRNWKRDFSDLSPPSSYFFLETERPLLIHRPGVGLVLSEDSLPFSWGAFVLEHLRPEPGQSSDTLLVPTLGKMFQHPKAQRVLQCFLFLEWERSNPRGPLLNTLIGLNPEGGVILEEAHLHSHVDLLLPPETSDVEDHKDSLLRLLYPLLLGTAYLNCGDSRAAAWLSSADQER